MTIATNYERSFEQGFFFFFCFVLSFFFFINIEKSIEKVSHSKDYLRLRQKLVLAVVSDVKFIHAVKTFGREWKEKKKKVRHIVILINVNFISANFHNVMFKKRFVSFGKVLNWSKLQK